ncbi:hypothetical protein PGKDCPLP_02299 [Stenotrophomonas maltophilia]|nr:hypothetical protein PGKDCPLP_02299 [Stenotrophomonas maltophilia]
MRTIKSSEMEFISGAAQAPNCVVVTANITGSNGVSSQQVAVVCSCPEGTTMSTTTSGGTTTATCN